MRIIFITPSPFPYYAGGVETWMYNVIKRIYRDHSVEIVAPSYHRMNRVFDLPHDVIVHNYYSLENNVIMRKTLRREFDYFIQVSKEFGLRSVLKKLIQSTREKTYFICVDPIFCGSVLSSLRGSNPNIRFITSLRGPHLDIALTHYPHMKRLLEKKERMTIRASDLILANGWDTKDIYDKKYNIECIVQKNGVDIDSIQKCDENKAIEIKNNGIALVSVATLIPIKGVYKLVDAIEVYYKKYKRDVVAYFVGKGDPDKLKKYANEKGVQDHIVCIGNRIPPYPYMKKATINVCLSGGSGLSMSMLESMAAGKPIIALDTPVYQQFNTMNQLELVEDNNSLEFAEKIERILNNYDKYLEEANKSKLVAEQFDWKIVICDFINNLESIS